MKKRYSVAFFLFLLGGCAAPTLLGQFSEESLLDWSERSNQAIREKKSLSTRKAVRANAVVHVSMHDALVSAKRENAGPEFERSAIRFAAARALSSLFPERADEWMKLAATGGESGKSLGVAIADRVFARTAFSEKEKTWLLESPEQFRPAPRHVAGIDWKGQFQELLRLRQNLSPEQKGIAEKWKSAPLSAVWGEVALDLIKKNSLDSLRTAEVLARLHATVDDAFLAYTDTQETYRVPRPEQFALRENVSFTPLFSTPKQPSYPSGLSTLSKAAATVLTEEFPAASPSLQALADETTWSRLYAGIHFPIDTLDGQTLGEKVAQFGLRKAAEREIIFPRALIRLESGDQ
ncbi:MAG TPA: hypothetical protein DD435_08890 [Cyanobacteria bacterium UBA8530]|nr:hypothetical protein [Cyanobacteria bacterium UBA8530]